MDVNLKYLQIKSSPDFWEYFTSTVLTMAAAAALDTLVMLVHQTILTGPPYKRLNDSIIPIITSL